MYTTRPGRSGEARSLLQSPNTPFSVINKTKQNKQVCTKLRDAVAPVSPWICVRPCPKTVLSQSLTLSCVRCFHTFSPAAINTVGISP